MLALLEARDAAVASQRAQVTQLQAEVAQLQSRLHSQLPSHAIATIQRMPDDDRRRLAALADQLGLDASALAVEEAVDGEAGAGGDAAIAKAARAAAKGRARAKPKPKGRAAPKSKSKSGAGSRARGSRAKGAAGSRARAAGKAPAGDTAITARLVEDAFPGASQVRVDCLTVEQAATALLPTAATEHEARRVRAVTALAKERAAVGGLPAVPLFPYGCLLRIGAVGSSDSAAALAAGGSAGTDEAFVVGVDLRHNVVFLEHPLTLAHRAGASVRAVHPTAERKKAFFATDTVRWVRNVLLGEVVDAAAAGGEVWRSLRVRQAAFETRPVPRSTALVLRMADVPLPPHVHSNSSPQQPLAVSPLDGSVVVAQPSRATAAGTSSPAPSSSTQLVAHHAKLTLRDLESVFDALDASAAGAVPVSVLAAVAAGAAPPGVAGAPALALLRSPWPVGCAASRQPPSFRARLSQVVAAFDGAAGVKLSRQQFCGLFRPCHPLDVCIVALAGMREAGLVPTGVDEGGDGDDGGDTQGDAPSAAVRQQWDAARTVAADLSTEEFDDLALAFAAADADAVGVLSPAQAAEACWCLDGECVTLDELSAFATAAVARREAAVASGSAPVPPAAATHKVLLQPPPEEAVAWASTRTQRGDTADGSDNGNGNGIVSVASHLAESSLFITFVDFVTFRVERDLAASSRQQQQQEQQQQQQAGGDHSPAWRLRRRVLPQPGAGRLPVLIRAVARVASTLLIGGGAGDADAATASASLADIPGGGAHSDAADAKAQAAVKAAVQSTVTRRGGSAVTSGDRVETTGPAVAKAIKSAPDTKPLSRFPVTAAAAAAAIARVNRGLSETKVTNKVRSGAMHASACACMCNRVRVCGCVAVWLCGCVHPLTQQQCATCVLLAPQHRRAW